jgi:RNA polymerase sigma-70 factor, ECF subfamily
MTPQGGLGVTAVAYQDESANEADVARLFEEHSEWLLGFCLRQLHSRQEAEDAVQTTFLYAMRALRRGVVPENEAAWLTAIAKNVCRSQRRTLARRGPLSTDLDLDTIALARADADEEGVLLGLRDALASIPERQRQALILREWRGLAPREIASELGMSGPATHALLTRARHSLAQALSPVRPVAGLVWLVVELRSHVKALLTGASTKAAAVTGVAIVGVGAGGVVAERTLADPSSPDVPAALVAEPRAEPRATPIVDQTLARLVATPRERAEQVARSGPPARAAATTSRASGETTRVLVPTVPTRSNDPATEPRTRDEQPPGNSDRPAAEVPVKPPPLPKVKPPNVVPPVDLPPVEVPPVDLPPIDLGPLPPVDLPPVELPPIDLPPLLP